MFEVCVACGWASLEMCSTWCSPHPVSLLRKSHISIWRKGSDFIVGDTALQWNPWRFKQVCYLFLFPPLLSFPLLCMLFRWSCPAAWQTWATPATWTPPCSVCALCPSSKPHSKGVCPCVHWLKWQHKLWMIIGSPELARNSFQYRQFCTYLQ